MNRRKNAFDAELSLKIKQEAAFPGATIADKGAMRPRIGLTGQISQVNLQLAQLFGTPRRAEIQVKRAVWPDRIKLQA